VWKADHKIVESNHILVLNWSHMTIPILRQITLGLEGRRGTTVVLLAQEDREKMRDVIDHELGPVSRRVVVRSGNPSSIRDLQKVSAGAAHNVLVLSPDHTSSLSDHGNIKSMLTTQLACIRSLQQIYASLTGEEMSAKGVVVASAENAPDMLMGFTLIMPTSFQQHVLATAALQRGLTQVYQEILDHTNGAALHLFDLDAHSPHCTHLNNLTISEIEEYFPRAVSPPPPPPLSPAPTGATGRADGDSCTDWTAG